MGSSCSASASYYPTWMTRLITKGNRRLCQHIRTMRRTTTPFSSQPQLVVASQGRGERKEGILETLPRSRRAPHEPAPHRITSASPRVHRGCPSRREEAAAPSVGWIGGETDPAAVMWALSRPEELMALVKLRVAAGQIKRHIPPEKHWASPTPCSRRSLAASRSSSSSLAPTFAMPSVTPSPHPPSFLPPQSPRTTY
jgi:hypothetical protein